MTALGSLADLYTAAGSMVDDDGAVELVTIADEQGAALDRATRQLALEVEGGEFERLRDLLASARRLRWRVSAAPFPPEYEPGTNDLVAGILDLAEQCKLMAGGETRRVLDDLARSATALNTAKTCPLGDFLLESLRDVDCAGCLVVVSGARAATATRSWFDVLGIPVPVMSDRDKTRLEVFQTAFLIGSPPLFGPAAFGAPSARKLVYLFPSWIADRGLPISPFSQYAEGGIRPQARLRRIGSEPLIPQRLRDTEGQLAPDPIWKQAKARLPYGADEAQARKILLCGGLSMMLDLDEGESIRVLDPSRPAGSRVQMQQVDAVGPGSYLVLREGHTDSGTLYERALTRLKDQAPRVEQSQATWKTALHDRLQALGPGEVVRRLRTQGVQAAAQAPAWTAHTLARPQGSDDFTILLRWLGLPAEPHRRHADMLRRARYQAMSDIREALEAALGDADMNELQRTGILRLDLDIEGFAGIVATRVLALSPYLDVVPRSELRIPKGDESARWLE
ncbi:hypothetical protein AB0B86_03050 [Micromonospora sp. NPDC049047]|uniref:hypothetical protein n=1 Tax=Micromonospora sp. NPDC049047 TaxID=3155645 RepID=UPI0033D619AE